MALPCSAQGSLNAEIIFINDSLALTGTDWLNIYISLILAERFLVKQHVSEMELETLG